MLVVPRNEVNLLKAQCTQMRDDWLYGTMKGGDDILNAKPSPLAHELESRAVIEGAKSDR